MAESGDYGAPGAGESTRVWEHFTGGVTQTILAGEQPGVMGNCLQAAVASVLHLPLDAVPHFSAFVWWDGAMTLWAAGRGLAVKVQITDTIPDRLCIVGGKSPRGISHAVVGDQGRIVWDPHPSRAGLDTITDVMWFEPRTPDPTRPCWVCGSVPKGVASDAQGPRDNDSKATVITPPPGERS